MGKCVIVEANGDCCVKDDCDIDTFLLSHTAGVYTVGRTLRERRAVVELAHHEERLVRSLRGKGLWPEDADTAPVCAALRHAWARVVRAAEGALGTSDELRLTALVVGACAAEKRVDIAAMAEALPAVRGPVGVEVWAAARDAPDVKDSAWVRKRKHMKERTHQPHINEVLLLHEDADSPAGTAMAGTISEGLSSNFFAVSADGTAVITAPEGTVLNGTVRAMVLRACDELHIRVVQECPRVPPDDQCNSDAAWSGAFVTSTTRMVLDIDTIHFIDHATETEARPPIRFTQVPHPLIVEIQQRTAALLDAVSTDIISTDDDLEHKEKKPAC